MSEAIIRDLVRRKPPVVQQVLRIIATKQSLERDDRVEIDGDEGARLFAGAMREWDRWVEMARGVTEVTESELAEVIVARLRKDPAHGWDRILRGRSN